MAIVGVHLDPRVLAATVPHVPHVPHIDTPGSRPFRVDAADASAFHSLIGQPFDVSPAGGGESHRLVLAKVVERPLTRDVAQFSLFFYAAGVAPLPDAIHGFHHAALGAFSLFIVSIGSGDADRRVYQACFSRHVRA
jgi:hypothetical protein